MVKNFFIVVFLMVLAFLVAGYFYFWETKEKKVLKQLSQLADSVSKEQKEGNIVMACKMQQLASLFSNSCGLNIANSPFNGDYSPQEIQSNTARLRTGFSSLKVEFHDINVSFLEENRAQVLMTARLTAVVNNDKTVDEVREIEAELKHIDGKWLFSNFNVTKVLE